MRKRGRHLVQYFCRWVSLRLIARLSTPRFTCLCCTLENVHWLSQGLNPLIACYSNYLHVISVRLHETMNYHLPDVSKQNRFHCIFLVLLKLLSLVLLKRKVHHSIGWIINNLRRGFRTLGSERLICWDISPPLVRHQRPSDTFKMYYYYLGLIRQ